MTRIKDLPVPYAVSPTDTVVMDVATGDVGPATYKVPLWMLCKAMESVLAPYPMSIPSGVIIPDGSKSTTFLVTLTTHSILHNPVNLANGMYYTWYIIQDNVGGWSLTFGNMFKWSGGTVPVVTGAAGAISVITGQYVSSTNSIYSGCSLDMK